MKSRNKRVLWLINHKTLTEFEPELLLDLGFEVYIPKLFPQTIENRSAGVTYEFDHNLTIPSEVLHRLNGFNFYTDKITPRIRRDMNEYFHILFVSNFPFMLQEIFTHFEGHIIFRVFGHAQDITYSGTLEQILGKGFGDTIETLGDRFHFGIAYKGIELIEPPYLKNRELYLPIGLPERFFQRENKYTGNDNRLLFICPLIIESPYYKHIYSLFKHDFSDIPHIIGGWQSKKVDDPSVLGQIEREEFDQLLVNMKVMYYHSLEPRHIHYHPLEAMALGMPVVYMEDGMLGRLKESVNQPGSCKTIREARKKIKRILEGDTALINSICTEQKRLLKIFTYEFCRDYWERNIIPLMENEIPPASEKGQKIAIIVPAPYKTGSFDAAKLHAKMLKTLSEKMNLKISVVFYYLKGNYDLNKDFNELRENNICFQEFEWEAVEKKVIEHILQIQGRLVELQYPIYYLPRDQKQDLLDCDLWIFVSDTMMYPPAPLRRYGIIIHDCLSRYFTEYQNPDVLNGRTNSARGADFIFTTIPATRDDIISYHGISSERVFVLPIEFDIPPEDQERKTENKENFFIWPTNKSPHKNITRAAEALLLYYLTGGRLKTVITGFDVEDLDVTIEKDETKLLTQVQEFRKLVRENKILRKNIIIQKNLPKKIYYELLQKACFLWYPTIRDNGCLCTPEAGFFRTPVLSGENAQMRYYDSFYKMNIEFFNQYSVDEMVSSLHAMEKIWEKKQAMLPSNDFFLSRMYRNCYPDYYTIVREIL